ncbi:MAG: hypothetical protein ACI8TQ_001910 [Planctomycetota bacterium]|jgi:hypothetical protein
MIIDQICLLAALLISPSLQVEQCETELRFPTFEPFRISLSAKSTRSSDEVSAIAKRDELYENLDIDQDLIAGGMFSDVSEMENEQPVWNYPEWLQPYVPFRTAVWLKQAALYLYCLKPLWAKEHLSQVEVDLANLVALYFSANEIGIKVDFEFDNDELNRESLKRLVRYFNELIAEPHHLAAMLPTWMCYGPYVGVPLDLEPIEDEQARMKLNDEFEIRLCSNPDRTQSDVLQGYQYGELIWSKSISTGSKTAFKDVQFSNAQPVCLGAYGWEVTLGTSIRGQPAPTAVYINQKGELFCFFVYGW